MGTVLGALLPRIFTLGLGFFAAWRHQFSAEQASVLNKVVLLYAVPLLLFAGTVTIKRDQLTADLGLAAAIAVIGEWDGRTSDGESGESGDASRPSQGEADDQEGEQVGAEHRGRLHRWGGPQTG